MPESKDLAQEKKQFEALKVENEQLKRQVQELSQRNFKLTEACKSIISTLNLL